MTSANSFIARMPAGIPGNLTRVQQASTEPQLLDTTNYPTAFGLPVAIDATSHGVRGIGAGDTLANLAGFYVRPFPQQGTVNDPLNTSTGLTAGLVDIMKRGYMTVLLGGATAAAKQGAVYIRTANPSTGKVVGDVEAAADTGVTAAAMVGTGNATAGTLSAAQTQDLTTPAGVYTVRMLTATTFEVKDALGAQLLETGNTGTTYTLDNGLVFRITVGGTPAVLGDTIAITVAQNTFVCGRNTYFTGPADGSNNVEIAFNI